MCFSRKTMPDAWLQDPRIRQRGKRIDGPGAPLWTDDYSNLLAALRWKLP